MAKRTDTKDTESFLRKAREKFRYDSCTGFLYRRIGNGPWKPGERVGSPNASGHRQVRFLGVLFMEHRLSWLIVHGKWPEHELDHINRIPDDNRMENLRECTHGENMKNSSLRKTNKTGFSGVSIYRPNGKYVAYISANGKRKYLGYHSDLESAIAARAKAEIELHGEFRRID